MGSVLFHAELSNQGPLEDSRAGRGRVHMVFGMDDLLVDTRSWQT